MWKKAVCFQHCTGKKQADKTIQLQASATFYEKVGWLRWQRLKPRGKNLEPRGRSHRPQGIIDRPWNRMKFSWLDFKIAWLFFFSFHFLPFRSRNICNCHFMSFPALHLGADNLCLEFYRLTDRDELYPRMDYTQSLPLPNWDDLDTEIWVLWTDLIYTRFWTLSDPVIGWGFGGTWDGENVFCVWDKHESLGPRVDCSSLNNGSLMIFTSQFPEPVNTLPYMAEGCSMWLN